MPCPFCRKVMRSVGPFVGVCVDIGAGIGVGDVNGIALVLGDGIFSMCQVPRADFRWRQGMSSGVDLGLSVLRLLV